MRTPRPHPLSADFRWEDRAGPFRRVTPAQREAFDRLGFVKFENAFTADEIATIDRYAVDGGIDLWRTPATA